MSVNPTSAVRLTGPFVTMIYSMLVGDMFRFSIIYVIFLFGFTQAFFFLFKSPPSERNETKKRFSSFPVTWMGLFHMTLGSYEYEEFRETYYQKLTQMVFAMFMVFTPILLLNMLIAMMGNTYCEVITQSEKEWVKQWANIVVALERGIDSKSAREYVQTYSIKMPSADKDVEIRGVIVIKSKQKSKAKEKKTALSLWKRVGKRTVQELRKCGGSAADVRRRYNLFRAKQPTLRLRMGKIIQEWNPTPAPPVTQPRPVPQRPNANPNNAGFNDLLSQVASASGLDIEKPTGMEATPKTYTTPLPQYNECIPVTAYPPTAPNLDPKTNTPTTEAYTNIGCVSNNLDPRTNVYPPTAAYTNIGYVSDNLDSKTNAYPPTTGAYTNIGFAGNNLDPKTNAYPPATGAYTTIGYVGNNLEQDPKTTASYTNMGFVGDNLDPKTNSNLLMVPHHLQTNGNQLHYSSAPEDSSSAYKNLNEGISVNVQTRIISTKVTKVRTPRRKDYPFIPTRRRQRTDSSSDDDGMGMAYKNKNKNFTYKVKHSKRRRKRNQISVEEKISLENVPYNIPISTETTFNSGKGEEEKDPSRPLFVPKSEEELRY